MESVFIYLTEFIAEVAKAGLTVRREVFKLFQMLKNRSQAVILVVAVVSDAVGAC